MNGDWWEQLSHHFLSTRGFPLPEVMRDQAERELRRFVPDSLDGAVEQIIASSAATQDLVDALGIGLTWFNREYQGITALVAAHNRMYKETGRNTTWLWSVGCSMGQEPYSIAIALLEADAHPLILATDFNREHLQIAKRGRYSEDKLRLVPPAIREKYFQKSRDGLFEVVPELRRCVTFEYHNFAIADRQPDGWDNLDGIICRNALIYYDPDEATRIASTLCRSLRPGGYFLVGSVDRPVLRRLKLLEVSSAGLARVASPQTLPITPKNESAEHISRAHRHTSTARMVTFEPAESKKDSEARKPRKQPRSTPTSRNQDGTPPTDAEQLMRHADELLRSGRESECVALLQSGVERFPLAAAVHLMLGISLKRTGDMAGATVAFRAARFLDANGWLAAYYLASCLEFCDEPVEAQRNLRETLRLIESKKPACCTNIPGTGDLTTLATTIAASCRVRLRSGA